MIQVLENPMRQYLNVVTILIAINVIIFFTAQSAGTLALEKFALYFPKNEHFGIWQIITHMFMHGGITHLLFNMFGLWMFATPLERIWGKTRFLIFYFVSGIGAAVVYTSINYYQFDSTLNYLLSKGLTSAEIQVMLDGAKYIPRIISEEKFGEFYHIFQTPMVGASGAIYGVLVAFGVMFPNTKLALLFIPFPIAAKYFIPAVISLDLFSGITGFSIFGGGVAHFVHVGGALIGFLMMMYWRKKRIEN